MQESLEKHKYLIALSHFPKFGPARLTKLLKYFQNEKENLDHSNLRCSFNGAAPFAVLNSESTGRR